jgi:peptide-methionine (R)-S-oxide reductase
MSKKRSEAEWQQVLSPNVFYICRQKGTEPAFTGEYWNTKAEGVYLCSCCGEPLFESSTKYDSGSGWPSFYQPINTQQIAEHRDISHGMIRVEVTCSHCDAHLGHVFPDGPEPTGLRYCINSASLTLKHAQ